MTKHNGESGNVIMFVFLAIALLAALSFAVSQGGRGSTDSLSSDRQRLTATEIIDYGNAVAEAVTQLRLRGTKLEDLRFSYTDVSETDYGTYGHDPRNEIFNPNGGGIIYKKPPELAMDDPSTAQYQFINRNGVKGIGTTCSDKRCSDLLMVAAGMKESVCKAVNKQLGVENPNDAPPVESDIEGNGFFKGTFTYSETVGDDDPVLDGVKEACVYEENEKQYTYYKVLIAR